MKQKYEKSNFEPIVKKSKTLVEICEKMGMNRTGGAQKTIKKYIELYELDTSHFNSYLNNDKGKIDLTIILVENSTYTSTNHLKNRLYNEGLKERKCEMCGQGEKWNDMSISLILDHINGKRNDNRIENLRIVCPNCNAGLDTHCKGHKKERKYQKNAKEYNCSECGKKIWGKSKTGKCDICYKKSIRKVKNRPDLETLLNDVKELGYCGTGKKYGVSDNTIRKWIKMRL